jgi:hypothetical protein
VEPGADDATVGPRPAHEPKTMIKMTAL